jgi:hypothetical protein
MAARKRRHHTDREREAIRTSQLINRLQGFVLSWPEPKTGKPIEMTASQVKAAMHLLRKTLPDLQQIEMTAELHHYTHEQALEELT